MHFFGLTINPLSQESISAAKTKMPEQGIGPCVTKELIRMAQAGEISKASDIPSDFSSLAKFLERPL
jgi:hypothetical protein